MISYQIETTFLAVRDTFDMDDRKYKMGRNVKKQCQSMDLISELETLFCLIKRTN